MVDGINSIRQTQKDMSINWNECTADEIIEYEGEGQEVPTEYLRWAQEMAKISGAPDDITYEMSISNENYSIENAGSPQANVAEGLKNGLDTQGTSLWEQGGIFADTSNQYNDDISNLQGEMETILANSQDALTQAQDSQQETISQIQALQSRQQTLKNDKTNMFAALQAQSLDQQIKALADTGIENINQLAQNIYNETNGIDAAIYTADTGSDIGQMTTDIGKQLAQMASFQQIAYAQSVINSGNTVTSKANDGKATFDSTADENTVNVSSANSLKDEIYKTSNTASATETDNQAADENQQGENVTQDNYKNEEKADTTRDDTEFTTDPNEILRRKERRGLIT